MVSVQNISLDQYDNHASSGSVAFSLSKQSERDSVHRFRADGWEVEVRRGCDRVVARTDRSLVGNVLIDAAIDYVHRALDLMSIEYGDHFITISPVENYILLQISDGHRIVRFSSLADLTIGIDASITIINADGSAVPQLRRPDLAWTSAFRFYRLSQASRDLFEAYRNLYLGLEALLDQLFPKRRREAEGPWLYRSILSVGEKVDLMQLATSGVVDPARDLVDRIYGIRVHLFHAKTGRCLIPDERVSYSLVADVYPILLELWTEIVRGWLSLSRGGGVVVHQGFRMMIEKGYASAKFAVTADDTLVDQDETISSPRGFPTHIFADAPSIVEVRPGRMALQGRTMISALPAGQVVGRVLIVNAEELPLAISPIPGGLILDGAEIFETVDVVRLINRGQPRTEFS